MKSLLSTVYLTVFFGCFFGKAQIARTISNGQPTSVVPILTTPPSTATNRISQFQVEGSLITQNSFVNPSATGTQLTGSFANNARWNSMGSLNSGSQILNGFRSQTDGRGLTMGFIVPNAGTVSNPFIEWIGNNPNFPTDVSTNPPAVLPGNLEFRYAQSPTGAAAARIPIFTMAAAKSGVPSFNYAATNAFIGQLQSGTFGSFNTGDTWSATGQLITPSLATYGTRHQYEGSTLISGFIKSSNRINAVMDFGNATNQFTNTIFQGFKFRVFTDPTQPNSVRNIWQSDFNSGNIMMGRQDINAVSPGPFYLSLFDGVSSSASNTALNFVNRAGIYVTTDGNDPIVISPINSYAAIVGDVTGTVDNGLNYGILGIAPSAGTGKWAGYFLGGVNSTGGYASVSDRKFKTNINDEENILSKLMQLQPKNYYFDVEKNKNMGFDSKLQHGLISQDVEQIFPELVKDAFAPNTSKDPKEDGKPIAYKGLNYLGFIPMLIKGLQEQQVQIEELKAALKTSNTLVLTNKTNLPAEIENKAFSLSQNTPNPFSDKTTISYTIPSNVSKATLVVFDMTGKLLLLYNLQNGKNNLVINGNTLQAGMYLYSLLADGQEVISKRMVLTK